MVRLRLLPLCALAGAFLSNSALPAQNFTPEVQIVSRIDGSQLVTLKGNTHPAAIAKNDRGRVSPDLPMTDLMLVLSRTPKQQEAFDKFVASQYDSSSPNFHRWLAPEEVGQMFGPAGSDVDLISNWLRGQGFSVDEVSKDRMSIRFRGTAGQVESAFHTEIHNLEVKGVQHIGNMSDPKIPAGLVPAVVGVKALHNFFPHPLHRVGSHVSRDSKTGGWQQVGTAEEAGSTLSDQAVPRSVHPDYGISSGFGTSAQLLEEVAPYDFATIYNVLPLWQAATPIDGTGQKIAIAGTSSINLSEVATFRSMFGLPPNVPTIESGNGTALQVCTGTSTTACNINDLIENTLDVEWAGAVAKGASIVLVSSASNSATDDTLLDSASYIVQHKTAPIMSVSYGECELGMGTAYAATYNNLWQTAASEGIAVFVASGDQGSAACDYGDQTALTLAVAESGLMVSGFASTPYNTAVGGTDFNWCNPTASANCKTAAPYWSATNNATTGASALGYVPEVPWNDTCTSPTSIAYLGTIALYVGASAVTDAETACNFVVNNYASIYTHYGHADLSGFVNVVGGSGGPSNCTVNTTLATSTTLGTCTAGSGYAKPIWQTGVSGIPADGVRDTPDVSFFAGDGLWNSSYLICASAAGTACTGTNTPLEVGGTSVSSPAMAGVMALINQKAGTPQGSPNTELYALAAKQTYSSCSAESVNNSSSCYFNDIDTGTIAMPCDNGLPAPFGLDLKPSPDCVAATAGDTVGVLSGYSAGVGYDMATGLGSLNVANVVNAWTSTVGIAAANVRVTGAPTSMLVNASLSVTVTLASTSGSGATPTGTVTLSGGGYNSGVGTLSGGSYTFSIPAGSLAIGSDTLTVTYSGDQTYAPATNNTTIVQVNGLTPTITVSPSVPSLNSNAPLPVTVTVAGVSGSATPTGTVTLSSGTYSSGAQAAATPGNYSFTIPANSLGSGSDALTAAYSGDTTYAAATNNSVSVTVTLSTFALTANRNSLTLSAGATSGNTSTISVTPAGGFTGTVNLSCAVTTSPASATSPATCSIPASVAISGAAAGTATLTVSTTSTTTTGAYAVTVTGTDAATGTITSSTPVSVTVNPAASFSLSNSGAISVAAGATTGNTSTISVTPSNGFTGAVTLSCAVTTSPASATSPATCSIPSSASITGAAAVTSTLTVATTTTTTVGSYAVTVSGTAGGVTQSTVVNVTVTAAAAGGGVFTLSATTPTAIATAGGTTTSTVTVSSSDGYAGVVSLTCALTSSPSGATNLPTCSSGSSTVTLSAATTSGTATVTVSTTASASVAYPKFRGGRGWSDAAGGLVLAFLVFLGIPARRRSWRSMLGVLALTAALWSMSGCAGFWAAPSTGTTVGSYTFTVTGSGNPAVTSAPTTTFSVTLN